MRLNFTIFELSITDDAIPIEVADKLLKFHMLPMQRVRNSMKIKIWASQRSGYRPAWWEKRQRRSGNSQHTFKGKGAVDWTCEDFEQNKNAFLKYIISHTNYKRIAVYNSFIHCDYKPTKSGKRELYTSNSKSEWTFEKLIS